MYSTAYNTDMDIDKMHYIYVIIEIIAIFKILSITVLSF